MNLRKIETFWGNSHLARVRRGPGALHLLPPPQTPQSERKETRKGNKKQVNTSKALGCGPYHTTPKVEGTNARMNVSLGSDGIRK